MMMDYRGSVVAERFPRQILPNPAELKAALAEPGLDEKADAGLADFPPLQPVSLAEHRQAKGWLSSQGTTARRHWLQAASIATILVGAGVLTRNLIWAPALRPLACRYGIPRVSSLSSPLTGSVHSTAFIDVSKDGVLEFPIEPAPVPSPPIEARMFSFQNAQLRVAHDLLQPQRRSSGSASFYVEQPVAKLLLQGAMELETKRPNELYLAIGRPGGVPRTAADLQRALQTPLRKRAEQSTWQIIHIFVRIAASGT
jgi:hypothetical protein